MLNAEFLSPYVYFFFPSLMVYSHGTCHTEAGLLPPGLSVVPVAFLSSVGLFLHVLPQLVMALAVISLKRPHETSR